MGPGPGRRGGRVVAAGTPDEVAQADTVTGKWLRTRVPPQEGLGTPVPPQAGLRTPVPPQAGLRTPVPPQAGLRTPVPPQAGLRTRVPEAERRGLGTPVSCSAVRLSKRRQPQRWLELRGARANNLKDVTLRLPLDALVGVCGVSGSGKSTLLIDTLGRALAPRRLTTSVAYEPIEPGAHDAIEGAPARAVLVDQRLAGVTSPADFLGLTAPLRALYLESEAAHALGIRESDLQRACSACEGRGVIRMDMGFLPTVVAECEACRGTGFLAEAWEVRWRGLALPEVYDLSIEQSLERFGDLPALARPLTAMQDVGLGYLVLRQPRHSLSGGEAQRLKIAAELCRQVHQPTLYILDEPTVGQHLEDVARLVAVLDGLVDKGHGVTVLEHHVHLLASCDWLIELGPSGGPDGGRIIACGTPEQVAAGTTPTAPFLREVLEPCA